MGTAAGAAGTTALNAVAYGDVFVRGWPASLETAAGPSVAAVTVSEGQMCILLYCGVVGGRG